MVDTINASFSLAASAFLWLNVLSLARTRLIGGVHWSSVVFFTALGCWNLVMYGSLHLWLSVVSGVSGVAANIAWLALAVHIQMATRRP